MTSSQGTEYYLKSMNGIKSFDDGSGTVIEDDTITVANITSNFISCETIENTGTFYSMAFSAGTLETSFISSATGNLRIGGDITTNTNISAGSIGTTGPISAGSITTTGSIGTTGSISCGELKIGAGSTASIITDTTNNRANLFNNITTGGIVIADGQTTGGLFIGTTPTGRSGNIVIGATGCNTESRGPIVGNLGVKTTTIDSITPTSGFDFLPSQKGDIYIGNGQTGNAIFIGQNKTSGFVLLGSANATTIIKRPLSCEGNIKINNNKSILASNVSDTVNILVI